MSAARKLPTPLVQRDEALAFVGPRRLDAETAAQVSPARELQASLVAELAVDDHSNETHRWPGVARIAFIGGSSCVLWGGLILGAYKLFSRS